MGMASTPDYREKPVIRGGGFSASCLYLDLSKALCGFAAFLARSNSLKTHAKLPMLTVSKCM